MVLPSLIVGVKLETTPPRKPTYVLVTWFTGHWDVTAVDDGHLSGAEVLISTELSSVRDDDEGWHLGIETEVRKPPLNPQMPV